MCSEHHSHRAEDNCYLCRAVTAAAIEAADEADDNA